MRKDDAIFNLLREYIKKSKNILFDGDGYGEAWKKEALKRGLSNHPKTPDAIRVRIKPKSIELYESVGVMNSTELIARHEVQIEEYVMKIQIESRTIADIARNHVIPTSIRYQNTLIDNVKGLKDIYAGQFMKHASEQMEIIEKISSHIAQLNRSVTEMIEARKKANSISNIEEKANLYCNDVIPFFDEIREHSDKLELIVDDELWPLAKYRELLFIR